MMVNERTVVWLVWVGFLAVVCGALVLIAVGCKGPDQGASTDIVAGEGAVVDATTDLAEDESTVEAGDIGGDVSTVRFGLDEGTTKVESKRVAKEAAHRASEKVMFAGVLIVLLAFAKVLPGWAFVAGISAIAGGPVLSLVLAQVL
ncbi:hypothetical protein CMI37_04455 [Candidatus Pacearchaeota archaeon]|nr:hypothetical protein [Candidatus Pacearchaeota archaeon]|tara:strand:- start:1361 stop:1798 length:438 start_codon:yes stop_codon:yes gene_type:complete